MWPVFLVFGGIGLILALSRSAKGAEDGVSSPSPVSAPGALPPLVCTEADQDYIRDVAGAISKGTATLEMAQTALPTALKCYPETAVAINRFIDIEKAKKAKAKTGPLGLVSLPDRKGTDIPKMKGKPAWFIDTRKGKRMAIPNFSASLKVFKALQKMVGAKQDGRIGPTTLNSFMRRMQGLKFARYPSSIEALAANAVKYTEVLSKRIPPAKVGGDTQSSPFPEASYEQWKQFVGSVRGGREIGEVSDSGQLGMFGANARRLGELGLMSDVRQITLDGEDRPIYMGTFTPPINTLENFLSSPRVQYKSFLMDMSDHKNQIQNGKLGGFIGESIGGEIITLSGLLGLAKQAGTKGAQKWLTTPSDRERFPYTTAMFRSTNNLF